MSLIEKSLNINLIPENFVEISPRDLAIILPDEYLSARIEEFEAAPREDKNKIRNRVNKHYTLGCINLLKPIKRNRPEIPEEVKNKQGLFATIINGRKHIIDDTISNRKLVINGRCGYRGFLIKLLAKEDINIPYPEINLPDILLKDMMIKFGLVTERSINKHSILYLNNVLRWRLSECNHFDILYDHLHDTFRYL